MPLDAGPDRAAAPRTDPRRPRIAVVGGGISGMATALALAPVAQTTLFEAAPRLGGHARTVLAGLRGDRPVDTGFIVFNHATYPHLGRLFRELEVPLARSEMSFGVSVDGGRMEFSFRSLPALFARPRNAVSPAFLGMLRDMERFNRRAEGAVREGQTVGELVAALGLGRGFRRLYLRPFCGAIWSTPEIEVDALPAALLVRFLRNHGLLGISGHHQWWTVAGGSVEYVRRLARRLEAEGVRLRCGAPVRRVAREAGGVSLRAEGGLAERFDEVVLACHPDQALALLADADPEEARLLGAIRYRPNRAVLHRDPGQMPRRRACWAAWVCRSAGESAGEAAGGIGVSYWMNRLQNIPESDPLFVTLNPASPVREEAIYDETVFRHPVLDEGAVRAQKGLDAIQGARGIWFAGAWLRNGFHEDGIASAFRIARRMGAPAW